MSECWYIVHTNPQAERKAAAEIRRCGFRAYLPKAAREFRHHRTKQLLIKRYPALVGYLFMRFPEGEPNWYALRQCQGVRGVLYSDGKPYRVDRALVAEIMRAQRGLRYDTAPARHYRETLRRGERTTLARARFRRGMLVRSATGPFEQLLARIERVTKAGTIEATATLFGRQTLVEYRDIGELQIVEGKGG
ncbi:MAG TPA: transcription termination/antitermination NusG family protein [Devosiaceae bacterium]